MLMTHHYVKCYLNLEDAITNIHGITLSMDQEFRRAQLEASDMSLRRPVLWSQVRFNCGKIYFQTESHAYSSRTEA